MASRHFTRECNIAFVFTGRFLQHFRTHHLWAEGRRLWQLVHRVSVLTQLLFHHAGLHVHLTHGRVFDVFIVALRGLWHRLAVDGQFLIAVFNGVTRQSDNAFNETHTFVFWEGKHHHISGEMLRKYGAPEEVALAAEQHHDDVETTSVEAVIVRVCDAVSAARPGARNISAENFSERMKELDANDEKENYNQGGMIKSFVSVDSRVCFFTKVRMAPLHHDSLANRIPIGPWLVPSELCRQLTKRTEIDGQ